MQSPEWTYLQTPQFTLNAYTFTSARADLELLVRNGIVTGGFCRARDKDGVVRSETELSPDLVGRRLHDIRSWEQALGPTLDTLPRPRSQRLVAWLQKMLPVV